MRSRGDRRRTTTVAAAIALIGGGLVACSGDAAEQGDGEPDATVSVAPPPTPPAPEPTTTTSTTTTTTIPGPPLSERLALVEVSAQITMTADERIVSVTTDADILADVVDPGDPALAAAWCTGATITAPGPFLVRVVDDAVGDTTGGLTGFELLGDDPVAPVGAGELVATLRIELDGDEIVVPDVQVVVADDPATGTFRGVTADGSVEGAFRCA